MLALVGCAAPVPPASTATKGGGAEPAGADVAEDVDRSRLIVADFVDALLQVPSLAPGRVRLATRPPDSRFSTLLLGALQGAGYDLRAGGEADGAVPLSWRIDPRPDAGTAVEWRFELSVGSVGLERRYRADERGVVPVSAMVVRGGGTERARPQSMARADRVPATAPARSAPGAPNAPDLPDLPDTAATSSGSTPNLFVSGISRHAARLAGHTVVRTRMLVFPNDSLRLGQGNKRTVQAMVADVDAGRDLISVIGCSHGATALSNGNERLALGRAKRVRDAFVLAGVSAERVLDEGCWAGEGHATMPPRGVVVTHHRGPAAS